MGPSPALLAHTAPRCPQSGICLALATYKLTQASLLESCCFSALSQLQTANVNDFL